MALPVKSPSGVWATFSLPIKSTLVTSVSSVTAPKRSAPGRHLGAQVKTFDADIETGIVIYLVRGSHLAAGTKFFQDGGLEAGPGTI
jgi:hypothetical protein